MKLNKVLTLVEAAADPSAKLAYTMPDSSDNLVEQLVEVFEKNCTDAAYMIERNIPFYRGTNNRRVTTFAIIDPTQTERKSQEGASGNYYTLFLDNHPDRGDWPKRKNSTIATTSSDFAAEFGSHTLVVIPFDDVKIGSVGTHDIWDTSIKWPFVHRISGVSLPDANNLWVKFRRNIIIPASQHISGLPVPSDEGWGSWVALDAALREKTAKEWSDISSEFDFNQYSGPFEEMLRQILTIGLLPTIHKMYGNENLRPKQTTFTTSTEFVDVDGEVWVGGKSLVMTKPGWRLLRKHYGFD